MPRLSLWQNGQRTNDFKFFDSRMSEMFTIGGTGINVHLYLGTTDDSLAVTVTQSQTQPDSVLSVSDTSKIDIGNFVWGDDIEKFTKVVGKSPGTLILSQNTKAPISQDTVIKISKDATQPGYVNQSAQNIQDLLFLENRDRRYDPDIYNMRGIYQVPDQSFSLSQFGLFLNADTIYMVFHLRDMIDTVGRKLMNGDVLEFEHLKDYHPLDQDLPAALKRYYVISEADRATEGYSPTWWPHLWRVKLQPLVDSQEYRDILDVIRAGDDSDQSLKDIISMYQRYIDINDAVIAQAETDVPLSGYDTSVLYVKGLREDGFPENPENPTVDQTAPDVSEGSGLTADQTIQTPDKKIKGYLTGDGLPPNGYPVNTGVGFPGNPRIGEYFLRVDFLPNRLFRWDGRRWSKVEDAVRTNLTPGASNLTQRSQFVNNTNTYTDSDGNQKPQRQALNDILKPKSDI
jgi:hypothetical protein